MKKAMILSIIALMSIFYINSQDKITQLKGKLYVTNRIHPELISANKTYALLIPRIVTSNLQDGEEVTIDGEKSSWTPNGFFTNEKQDVEFISVAKISARGKTVDIEKEFGKIGDRPMYRGRGNFDRRDCPNCDSPIRGNGPIKNGNRNRR